MQRRKNIQQRVTLLYVLFFGVLAGSLVLTFSGTAFLTSLHDVREEITPGAATKHLFSLPNKTDDFGHELHLETVEGSIDAIARISSADVVLTSPRGTRIGDWRVRVADFAFLFSVAAYIAIFVIVFYILAKLRRGVRTGNPFEKKSIRAMRLIGILLISASLLTSVYYYLEARFAAEVITSDIFRVDTSFSFSFGQIVTGVLILFLAEIFSIGHDLSEEQKLTI